MSRYKHILLDLDETIFDFKEGERLAFADVCKSLNIANSDSIYSIYKEENLKCWKALERKDITKPQLLQLRWTNTFSLAQIKMPCEPSILNDAYMRALGNYGIYLPHAEEFMRSLKALPDIKIHLITNGTSYTAHNRIIVSGISQYIDNAFISDDMGVNKPDKLFFDKVLSSIDAKPDECLVIGDSLTSDIKGANNAEIPCCLYSREGDFPIGFENYKIDYLAKNYDEILAFISQD